MENYHYKIMFFLPDVGDVKPHYEARLSVADRRDWGKIVYEATAARDFSDDEIRKIDADEIDLNDVEGKLLAKLVFDLPKEYVDWAAGVFYDYSDEEWKAYIGMRVVRRLCRKHGYSLHPRTVLTPEKLELARSMIYAGAGAKEIAQELEVSAPAIYQRFPDAFKRKARPENDRRQAHLRIKRGND